MNRASIAKPPWSKLGKLLESCVRKALFDYQMIEGISHLGVALSGGKDSLTLLFLLHAISRGGFAPFKLTAFHVSGAFSCGANLGNTLLRSICDQLEVPLILLETEQNLATLECYSCSRKRRKLLFDAAKANGIHTLAFGHHKDDCAQTLLMNLFHKGEFATMLPKIHMVRYEMTIIRPLIYVSEAEISSFAELYQFKRISCQCPVGQQSLRKKTDQILTELEELFPNIRANVAHAGLAYGSNKANQEPSYRSIHDGNKTTFSTTLQ